MESVQDLGSGARIRVHWRGDAGSGGDMRALHE